MTVATERVFRSNEKPKLKLTTRNVESVTVRAYKVDLETYFRKMHLAGGVEGLDIALIDPDQTFEFKVPKYAKYQQFQSEIEVPLPGDAKSGVMAVTVSSKTLEATTLVIQSDLDIIVKSSRDEVFVFAENMLTGKPWADARLLISNGQQVFAEGTTGKDGVFQKSFKELKEAGDVRVFAVAGGNAASNVVDLQGVGIAQGLERQGLHLHRPARLSSRPGGPCPRLPAPRLGRRLRGREGQEVHLGHHGQPQSAAAAGDGQAGRVRQLPHVFRPARLVSPRPVSRVGPRRRRSRTTRAGSSSRNIASSRCGWWSIRRETSTTAARRSKA